MSVTKVWCQKRHFYRRPFEKFYLALNLLNVEHEDVVCKIFPCTFEAKESSWFFVSQDILITNWDTFERVFKSNFGSKKTTTSLMKELLSMKMDKKEKIQYFNHIFTSLLSSFSATNKPAEVSLIEYYTTTLYPPIAMFVKR